MNMWSEKHSTLPSKIDKMKGLTIEMTFEYPGVDGAKCMEWYRGRIIGSCEGKFVLGIINCLFILIFVNIMHFYLFRNKYS